MNSKNKKQNLIILNGQLKYYQTTLSYWKQFSEINNCHILIITQSTINYKDHHIDKINHRLLKQYLGDYTFIVVT